ncbi:SusC/RagA family TonB-linked outer membrane protein [Polaribacter gangjinensis]|uniref:SusC/RagA family TonB-linked outer membrane protein n=1 Tax=Polaribacter gangjinensis TaxID=574710 RepID=A0A2S7WC44_9FLAO|nr:SusC/RagA family TonB-linked outer membrane protein [Polaribacter gangjinensis]PQJ74976.1 SusC/RagA family TonB-linked outer membrane protein [Polaribacter gangjinensis]
MKTKLKGILTLLLALVVQVSFAQEKTVSGTVSDSSGNLPGVSVLIKGTKTGTETDFNGKYTIKAKVGDILSFSYVGYKTSDKKVGASNTIDVVLVEDAGLLDEIVITSLGIKRDKKALGFSQQSVKPENLVRTRETDLNNALAGRVSGVQAVGAPSAGFGNSGIRLRGQSISLYIVDNVKVNSISDINTDDIADLTVLKGAAATALYGPEAFSGIIIITTKSAKQGQSTITLNHSTAMENVYLLPDYQNEYGGGYSQEFNTFNFNPAQHPASWAAFDGQSMVEYYADESWGPKMNGQMVRHWDSWIQGDPEFGKLRPFSPNPNNVKNFFDTGVVNNTTVDFTKGGEGYNIKGGIVNIDRTSVMPNSFRRQVQAYTNIRFNITDKLEAYANINYQDRRTRNFPDNGYGNVASNFNQWWQRQLDMDRVRNYNRNGSFVSWNINGPTDTRPLYWDSPFFETNENLNFQTKNATYGRMGLNYTVNDNLNGYIELRKTYSSYTSNDRTAFGGLNLPSYSESDSFDYRDEVFGIMNYSKDLSEDLDFNASAGFELITLGGETLNGSTVGGLTTLNFYSLSTSVDRPTVTNSQYKQKSQGVFSKVSFGYKDMLFVDGSARFDWGSTANPNDNRVETYGGSVSFIFSKLIPQNDIISFGKLRASAASGPFLPARYVLSPTFDIGTPYGSSGTLSSQGTFANPQLSGGQRQDFEFGTELKLFNNKVDLDVTYFSRKDKNLPSRVSLDGSTGFTQTFLNSGQQTSSGIEIGVNFSPIKSEDFEWNVYSNFSTLKRKVDAIADGVDVNVLSESWRGIQLQERVGEEWGAIYGRAFRRDADGNMILSSTGNPLYDTNQYLGNVLPDFTGGLSNNIRYKNFNLGFDIDFQSGGKVFSVTRMFNNYSGLGIETVGLNNLGNPVRDAVADGGGVLIEGVDATTGLPASYNVEAQTYWGRLFALHERWLYDASYVKLRTVRLDYDLPAKLLEKTPFKKLNLGVFANNVWLIHSAIPGLDPSEIETANGVNWTEGGQLPNVRTIGINVRMTF